MTERIWRSEPDENATKTVLVRLVTKLLDLGAEEGLNRGALMGGAGLKEADISDPDGRVPLSAMVALWQLLGKGITDPTFGIRAGGSLRFREMGLLGYAMYVQLHAGRGITPTRPVWKAHLRGSSVQSERTSRGSGGYRSH